MSDRPNNTTRQATPRLINTYDQLKAAVELGVISRSKAVSISYHPRPTGRMGMAQISKSVVYSPFFKTDPNAPWYDYGNKTFSGKRSESFEKAKEWASETYGIKEWKANRMRCHVPAEVQDKFPLQNLDG